MGKVFYKQSMKCVATNERAIGVVPADGSGGGLTDVTWIDHASVGDDSEVREPGNEGTLVVDRHAAIREGWVPRPDDPPRDANYRHARPKPY